MADASPTVVSPAVVAKAKVSGGQVGVRCAAVAVAVFGFCVSGGQVLWGGKGKRGRWMERWRPRVSGGLGNGWSRRTFVQDVRPRGALRQVVGMARR